MDNDNNSPPHFEETEMEYFEDTIVIYNDVARANMNLISKIEKQIKKHRS